MNPKRDTNRSAARKTERRSLRKPSITITLDMRTQQFSVAPSRDDISDEGVLVLARGGYMKVLADYLEKHPKPEVTARPKVGETPSGLIIPSTVEVAAYTHPDIMEAAQAA